MSYVSGNYRVQETGFETPCHIWQRMTDKRGYGVVRRYRQGQRYAHVVAWEEAIGPVPEGHELHHRCEVRSCIRVDHLEAVTDQEHADHQKGKDPQRRWINVSLEFEPDAMASIEAAAAVAGMTPHDYILDAGLKMASGEFVPMVQRPPEPLPESDGSRCSVKVCDRVAAAGTKFCVNHTARPGVQVARFCTKCQRRQFGDPEWKCDEHPAKTITQPNVPYFGQPTT